MKNCTKCKQLKPLSDFSKKGKNSNNHFSACKSCVNLQRADKRENKFRRIWEKYKISEAQYIKLTRNGCEICGSLENLCIDHNHNCCPGKTTCGQCVSGVLCRSCNLLEASVKNDFNKLQNLTSYIERKYN